jgi:putative Mg2+ transporter-C (MgtC) family protein
MNFLAPDALLHYWSFNELSVNLVIFMNLLGALLLGALVGYERTYHGRAAGMRTYGLVCMAASALVAIPGYPAYWYAGQATLAVAPDPTRVIQGIVTGIGFLGAGVIMKEGFSISGLTTAASIWASSAIGILVGVGFYPAAILLALLSASCMMWMSKVEGWLPSRQVVAIVLRFRKGFDPHERRLRQMARERGYEMAEGSLNIDFVDGELEWRFVAAALGKSGVAPLSELAEELTHFDGVKSFHLSHARN